LTKASQPAGGRIILLDVEGTTTPKAFVYQTLFPYARDYVREYLLQHLGDSDVRTILDALQQQNGADTEANLDPPLWWNDLPVNSAVSYVHWLMDRDSKLSALKDVQGKILVQGYESGQLRGEVYPDVRPAFERWARQGRAVCIFSSGSVLAQKLLFGLSTVGDLTPFIRAYFDTATGGKREAESYRCIARELGSKPDEILFVSDVAEELDAACAAGAETLLCARPGESDPAAVKCRVVQSFDEVFP
jgi:enolase-phosphatase E1